MRFKGFAFALALALLALSAATSHAVLRTTPGLDRVRVVEVTGGPNSFSFGANSAQMLNRLAGNLASGNSDFNVLANEHYDVFYSDAAGSPDQNGDFISVECTYTNTSGGGGGNIAAVFLVFLDGTERCACIVASAVYLGGNAIVGSAALAANCNTADFSTMGSGTASQRTRITLDYGCVTPASTSTWGAIKLHYR